MATTQTMIAVPEQERHDSAGQTRTKLQKSIDRWTRMVRETQEQNVALAKRVDALEKELKHHLAADKSEAAQLWDGLRRALILIDKYAQALRARR